MQTRMTVAAAAIAALAAGVAARGNTVETTGDPASLVNPLIGTANGGNTFPGAVVPFGMVQWSPETTRGDRTRPAAPGGYAYDATRIRGFSLTHLSGTGCRGASGDIPFMPIAGAVTSSPSSDQADRLYASRFAHANERATASAYDVRLQSGVRVQLAATARTGVARFTFPAGAPATLLVRASDSEVGSSDARVAIDEAARTIRGSVTSGNFCGYIDAADRRSYYTLHFVAVFDRRFATVGTWTDDRVAAGATDASGGTTYGADGYPVAGRGAGAFVTFGDGGGAVNVRVGISYVSAENAAANLEAESPEGATVEATSRRAHESWNAALGRMQVGGGAASDRTIFYTALYHALLHPNVFSDANGQYEGMDGRVHVVAAPQRAQYANFSGWDVYRSQLPLVALLDGRTAGDIAQSLFNQAAQNQGAWDRWTHNAGATHVMEGDPSPAAVAGIYAFGGTNFDARGAYRSLLDAATRPTAADASRAGCPVECPGQRPSLDQWLTRHYIAATSNAWGGAGETLEDAAADFALSTLARRLGEKEEADVLQARAGYWRNVFNPAATPSGGYVQDRRADLTWPPFDPASSDGFAEGSSAQYTWMVPFDARGLIDAMGGPSRALERLDAFFRAKDGSWALTALGARHAEMDNEPSTAAAWLYDFAGRPDETEATVREAMIRLWRDAPDGIPGNDDLGAMSAWYVWAAAGLYPGIPGRAELLVGSPLFPHLAIARATGGSIVVDAPDARADAPYVTALRVNGQAWTKPWLPESFIGGGRLEFDLASAPSSTWGRALSDAPPSFPPTR